MHNGNVVEMTFCQSAVSFFGRSPEKATDCIPPLITIRYKVSLNWMKNVGAVVFWRAFAKCTVWPQTELKWPDTKSTPHTELLGPRVTKYHQFCSTVKLFLIYCAFNNFPIDLYVKISNCHKTFKTWPIAKKVTTYISLHIVANVLLKFGWYGMKPGGGVTFWNFQLHMVVCYQRFHTATKL